MTYPQLSPRVGTTSQVPDELLIELNSKLAEECEEHQALTKKMMDDNRMAVQSQLDDMRRTFQDMFDDHRKSTELVIEEHRRTSEQRLREVSQTCQQLDIQLGRTMAEERAAVQGALQAVAQVLQRERAESRVDMQHAMAALRNGLPSEEPPCSSKTADGEALAVTPGQLDAALEALRRELQQQQRDTASHASPALELGGPPKELSPRADHELVAIEGDAGGGKDRAVMAARQHGGAECQDADGEASEVCDPEEEEVAFAGSIWDAAVFIGCPQVGACASAFTVFMLLINIGMQALFCLIVNDNLTHSAMYSETVQDFKDWRTTIAHNVKFVDSLTHRSLARKVCSFRDAPLSSGPIAGLAAISQYSPLEEEKQYHDTPPLGYWFPLAYHKDVNVGELMCGVSVVLWWFAVLKEIYSIVALCQALFFLPCRPTKISSTSGAHALVAVSLPRRVVFCTVIVVRSMVCFALAVCGTLYLAATLSLGDLLLNALALEIVLSLDELTFDVLAPRSVRLLLSSMAPLAKPRSRSWRGLDGRPVLALAVIGVSMYGVFQFILRDQSTTLEAARHELCGGNLDFVAGVTNTGLVAAFSPGANYHEAVSDTEFLNAQYEYRAFRSLIENESDAMATVFERSLTDLAYGFKGSRHTVEGRVLQDVEASTFELNVLCVDLDYPGSEVWATLTDILDSIEFARSKGSEGDVGNDFGAWEGPFRSCADVQPVCGEESTLGTRARQFCPETCGCDHPASAIALFTPEHGCPRSCTSGERWLQKLREITCSDWTPEQPRIYNGTDWYQGVDMLQTYAWGVLVTGWPPEFLAEVTEEMFNALYGIGCAGAVAAMVAYDPLDPAPWQFGNLCEETNSYGFRPITAICPVACGCRETHALLCPATC